jgi:hypothetical protein
MSREEILRYAQNDNRMEFFLLNRSFDCAQDDMQHKLANSKVVWVSKAKVYKL